MKRPGKQPRGESGDCSGRPADDPERRLEAAIVELLNERGAGKTICPSDAARRVSAQNWRALMEATRAAARRLAAKGEIVITQRGRDVDPMRVKGAIRLRKAEIKRLKGDSDGA